MNQLEKNANGVLENRVDSFHSTLIRTNSDGGWYQTNWPDRSDINNDDDDFDGSASDVDHSADNDADAFKNVYWVIDLDSYENVWNIFPDDESFRNNTIEYFTGINIESTGLLSYDLFVFDNDSYENDNILIVDNKFSGNISAGASQIIFDKSKVKNNDIVALFFHNLWTEPIMYKISWIDNSGGIINKMVSSKIIDRNFFFQASVVLQDEKWKFVRFRREFYPILPSPIKPIAPSFLHTESASGSLATIAWDLNETKCNWYVNVYRSWKWWVSCDNTFLLEKNIPLTQEYINIIDNAGTMDYTVCAVCIDNKGNSSKSTQSNTLIIHS